MLNTEMITYNSPHGNIYIAKRNACVCAISFTPIKQEYLSRICLQDHEIIPGKSTEDLISQLDIYFSGNDPHFTVPLCMGGTLFERKVWKACLRVPYGETASYRQLAELIGKPHAVRAVGNALSKNPLPIIIPCHRIIRSDGRTGEYGGGSTLKQILINSEKER